jgi:UDP-N-acetylglucosamine:LPS N-acetylglucosamine transferase/tetratricopeptide (TPR) repeat protein
MNQIHLEYPGRKKRLLYFLTLKSALQSFLLLSSLFSLVYSFKATAQATSVALFYIGTDTSGTGSGHVSNGHTSAIAALQQSIEQEAKATGKTVTIQVFNINQYSTKNPADLSQEERDYIELLMQDPEEYTRRYEAAKRNNTGVDPLFLELPFDLDKLATDLEANGGFDTIIGAHWLVSVALQRLKLSGRIVKSKTGFLLTDYNHQPFYAALAERSDGFFVGAEGIKEKITSENKSAESKIFVSGIPIHESASAPPFSETEKLDFRASVDLNRDKEWTTITLAGGGEGIGDFPTIVEDIKKNFCGRGKKVQIVAMTGKNQSHKDKLASLERSLSEADRQCFKILINGTISDPKVYLDYVRASDVYIVKSGGLSPTEGAVIGVPMILLDVLGGHEKDNAEFYELSGIAVINRDPHNIGQDVEQILKTPGAIPQMLLQQEHFKRARDFKTIVNFALSGDLTTSGTTAYDFSQLATSKKEIGDFKAKGLGYSPESEYIKLRTELRTLPKTDSGGQFQAFLGKVDELLPFMPGRYHIHYLRSHILRKMKRYDDAIAALQESLKFDHTGGLEGQHIRLADLYLTHKNDPKLALVHLSQHIQLLHRREVLDQPSLLPPDLMVKYDTVKFMTEYLKKFINNSITRITTSDFLSHLEALKVTLSSSTSVPKDEADLLYILGKNYLNHAHDKHLPVTKNEYEKVLIYYAWAMTKLPNNQSLRLSSDEQLILTTIVDKQGTIQESDPLYAMAKEALSAQQRKLDVEKQKHPEFVNLEYRERRNGVRYQKGHKKLLSDRKLFEARYTLKQKSEFTPKQTEVENIVQTCGELCACEQSSTIEKTFVYDYLDFAKKLHKSSDLSDPTNQKKEASSLFVKQLCSLKATALSCKGHARVTLNKIDDILNEYKVSCYLESVVEAQRANLKQKENRIVAWKILSEKVREFLTHLSSSSPTALFTNIYEGIKRLVGLYDIWLKDDQKNRLKEKFLVIREFIEGMENLDIDSSGLDYANIHKKYLQVKDKLSSRPIGDPHRDSVTKLEQGLEERSSQRSEWMQDIESLIGQAERQLPASTGHAYPNFSDLLQSQRNREQHNRDFQRKVDSAQNGTFKDKSYTRSIEPSLLYQ